MKLREAVLRARFEGRAYEEVALLLGIGRATVNRILRLHRGGIPLYLPTYSPELDPIERLWADMKRRLRTLALNAERELLGAVRRLRASTPIAKIAAWFRHSIAEAHIN